MARQCRTVSLPQWSFFIAVVPLGVPHCGRTVRIVFVSVQIPVDVQGGGHVAQQNRGIAFGEVAGPHPYEPHDRVEDSHKAGDDDCRNDDIDQGPRRHVAVLIVGGRVEENDGSEREAGYRQVAESGAVDGVELRSEGRREPRGEPDVSLAEARRDVIQSLTDNG